MSMAKTILIFGVPHKVFADSDTVEAAEPLLQLSDGDFSSNSSGNEKNNKNIEGCSECDSFGGEEERKMEEIIGEDGEEEVERERRRPERKRRYKYIEDIYRETLRAVWVGNEKKRKKTTKKKEVRDDA